MESNKNNQGQQDRSNQKNQGQQNKKQGAANDQNLKGKEHSDTEHPHQEKMPVAKPNK